MSRIPTFQSSVPIPRVDTSGQQAIAGAIGNVGGQLGELAIQMQRVKNADEANTLAIQSHDEAAQILSEAALVQGGNIDAAEQQAIQKLNELRDRQIGAASNDRVRSSVYRNIGTSIAQSQASVRGHFNKIRIDDSKKLGAISSFNNAKEYVAAATQKGRDIVRDKEFARIDDDPHLREGQQAVAKHKFMEDIIPRLGKEGERLTYNKMIADGDFEKAIDLMDSVEYMPAIEVRENRARAVQGATMKVFRDEQEELNHAIDLKDTSNVSSLVNQAVNRINKKGYIHSTDADIAVNLIQPLIERAADEPNPALYNALNAVMPHNIAGGKVRNRTEDVFDSETASRVKEKVEAQERILRLFQGGGPIDDIPHDSKIVSAATEEFLALGGSLEELVVRYAREGKRLNTVMAKVLDIGLEPGANEKELARSMNILLIIRDVSSDDQARLQIDALKHAGFARVLYSASKNAATEAELIERAKLFSSEKSRKRLAVVWERLRLAGQKDKKGKPVDKLYIDDVVFGQNGRPSPADRSSYEAAYMQAAIEVAAQASPDVDFEELKSRIDIESRRIWHEDHTIVRIPGEVSIFNRGIDSFQSFFNSDPMTRKMVPNFIFNGSTQTPKDAINSFESAIISASNLVTPVFKTEAQPGAAFQTAGGVFIPIMTSPRSDNDIPQVDSFMMWNARTQTSEIISSSSDRFSRLKKVMKVKTDPRRLKPFADLRWDESYGSTSAQEANPELPQKIALRFQAIYLKNNKGRPAITENQKNRKARQLTQFANRLGWTSILSPTNQLKDE